MDPRARKRYEALFDTAMARGGTGKGKLDSAADGKLDGMVVRRIWLRSRLKPAYLRNIFDGCDEERTGKLTRESFGRGLWEIDEELRRRRLLEGR